MPHIKRLLAGKIPLFVALLYSFVLSAMFFLPGSDLPKVSFSAADKIIHGAVYFILINLWSTYFYLINDFRFDIKWVRILFFSTLLYGIIIEILQGLFTASRSADIYDVCANLIGSIVGIFFFNKIKHHLNI